MRIVINLLFLTALAVVASATYGECAVAATVLHVVIMRVTRLENRF